ncbi:hypothetical protein [Paenarthrobacter sp. NPDC057981]|uniref:hypothetical protein n=1 Tax=Paenarthrobacter sp. NPDC057981 TaxID=3346297 RepID=UPI0036D9A12A
MSVPVVVDIVRTVSGKGKTGGALSTFHPVELLVETIAALVSRNGFDPVLVEDVLM